MVILCWLISKIGYDKKIEAFLVVSHDIIRKYDMNVCLLSTLKLNVISQELNK